MPLVGTALATAASAAPRTVFISRRMPRLDPRRFGRSQVVRTSEPVLRASPGTSLGSALGLFVMTFLAGFLFVSILLA
ncbi:hypothetical protein [Sphingomonas sp.]|uniref:hypothetical protein n=1 Tax=Sphingomonas sp. TaxID=28214 RepID=UPI0025D1B467|nr:hypothetical protein [Sphingomonas sp.]MBV9527696.1 hypothetical protein [Sphingomonas sp.]